MLQKTLVFPKPKPSDKQKQEVTDDFSCLDVSWVRAEAKTEVFVSVQSPAIKTRHNKEYAISNRN